MALHVAEVTIPATASVGIFASSGITAASYSVFMPEDNDITIVNSSSASAAGFNPTYMSGAGLPFVTDGSEVYLYNSSASSITLYILLAPVVESQGPTSSSTTYSY